MQNVRNSNFNFSSSQIHLWQCELDKNAARLDEYHMLLSSDELRKAERFKFEKDRNCYIISKGILRILLGRYLAKTPSEIKLEYTSYGKPMISSETKLKFNISHSGNMAVFGFVKDVELGVDIEKIKEDFNVMDIAQNFFSSKEIQALYNIKDDEKKRAFYRCWTRKESFIKAEGSGLSFPLDKFAVSLDADERAELLQTVWNKYEKDSWSLFSFVPHSQYIGAIAVRKKIVSVTYYDWDEFAFK